MNRRRDPLQERFDAHDRRFRIIRETGSGSVTRMMQWAQAYLRRERVADARHRRRYDMRKLSVLARRVLEINELTKKDRDLQ